MLNPGKGAKAKGANFESEVGRRLSRWLTNGQRHNIFARNVLSGGAFTVTARKGGITNIPGDLMAANPLAFDFLSLFSIECKHRADIDLDTFLRDRKGTSFLAKTIRSTKEQAEDHGVTWMIIAKQNRFEPVVLTEHWVGRQMIKATPFPSAFRYHVLFNDTYIMTTLYHLSLTNAYRFIQNVSEVVTQREVARP